MLTELRPSNMDIFDNAMPLLLFLTDKIKTIRKQMISAVENPKKSNIMFYISRLTR